MEKLSLKEYLESKKILKQATNAAPKARNPYSLLKYCKLPVINESGEKIYISLKPKDIVTILWEHSNSYTTIHNIISDNVEYIPLWSDEKMINWIKSNTIRHIQ